VSRIISHYHTILEHALKQSHPHAGVWRNNFTAFMEYFPIISGNYYVRVLGGDAHMYSAPQTGSNELTEKDLHVVDQVNIVCYCFFSYCFFFFFFFFSKWHK
jgi:hypothetical protein